MSCDVFCRFVKPGFVFGMLCCGLNLRPASDRSPAPLAAAGPGRGEPARAPGDPVGPDSPGGNEPPYVGASAFRAFRGGILPREHDTFEPRAASAAFIFVNRHHPSPSRLGPGAWIGHGGSRKALSGRPVPLSETAIPGPVQWGKNSRQFGFRQALSALFFSFPMSWALSLLIPVVS